MTIEVNYNPIRQQGNGVTTQFSYDFYALSPNYLIVYIEEDGVQTVTTDYTATASETGGIVTFNVAPTENQYVVITRSTTINQEVPYTTSRGFDAKVVESSFDKDIAISQELQNQLIRTPKLPEGYNYNIQLPNPDDGKALVWNGNQGAIRNSDYTLKESMERAAASAELSKDWAEKTTGLVSGDFSSKAYAIGGTGTETNNAKYYARQASNSADVAYAAATNENVVAVGTDLRTDNNIGAVVENATNINNVAENETNINNVANNRTNINTVATNIANVNTNATNINAINTNASNISAIQSANANAQSALNSKNKAQEWATSENIVDNIDYSAKHYANQSQISAELSAQYANDKINQTHITNCITEIPQDIKLELNDGVLTLKAGSKVYKPDNSFIEVANDISVGYGIAVSGLVAVLAVNKKLYFAKPQYVTSGNTAPTTINERQVWYDTTANIVKMYAPNSSNFEEVMLPIAIVSSSGVDDKFASIDQVFNGFGYIGSTVFALPGVKGLIPNGRNADGTLNNIEFTVGKVRTYTNTGARNNSYLALSANDNDLVGRANEFEVTDDISQSGVSKVIYSPTLNKNIIAGGIEWKWAIVGRWSSTSTSQFNVTSIQPKLPFRAVDYSDGSWLSGLGMPSSKYIDLTLGASDSSTYKAPANGYFYLRKAAMAANQYIDMENITSKYSLQTTAPAGRIYCTQKISAQNGDLLRISYTVNGPTDRFRFIYAEGENS